MILEDIEAKAKELLNNLNELRITAMNQGGLSIRDAHKAHTLVREVEKLRVLYSVAAGEIPLDNAPPVPEELFHTN